MEHITSLDELASIAFDSVSGKMLRILTNDTTVVIWGMGIVGKSVAKSLYAVGHHNIIGWDKSKINFSSVKDVRLPTPEKLSEDEKQQYVFIVAIYDNEVREEIIGQLQRCGCRKVFSGLDVLSCARAKKVMNDYETYKRIYSGTHFPINDKNLWIITSGLYTDAGTGIDKLYLNQDLWAARKIYRAKPSVHYDIGSRVDGFITHLLSFEQKVVLLDIRPLETFGIDNLEFIEADATKLSGIADGAVESLSALCSPEHFGLGRYGDAVDPDAHKKLYASMRRVLREGGDLYISVPVSAQSRLEFNAYRIYAPGYILKQFAQLQLVEFSVVKPGLGLIRDYPMKDTDKLGKCDYGLFHFQKQ